jgi:hypothetical protein
MPAGQGDVQFQYRATFVTVYVYLNHIVTDLHILANHVQQLLLELWQVIRHVALAPFVGHDNLQPFLSNARSIGLLASEIIQKTHPLAPFEHP